MTNQIRTSFIIAFSFLTIQLSAQEIKAEIKKVTVFQQGAQVVHQGKVNLNGGISKITLNGLTQYLDANSVQVKISGTKIISLNYQVDYLCDNPYNEKKKLLQDSLDRISYLIDSEKNNKLSFEQELKLIETNVQIKGQAALEVANMQEFLTFYRNQLPAIRTKILDSDIKIKAFQKTQQRLQQALNNLNANPQGVTGVLAVEVSSLNKGIQDVEISYFVSTAGWEPFYNMRVSGVNQPVNMEYNANVYQTTGIDWKGVQLTLATGTPQLDNNLPVLNPWWVNFYYPQARATKQKSAANYKAEAADQSYELAAPMASGTYSMNVSTPVQISENISFFEFKIPTPYNINSDGQQQRVEISQHQLAAQFSYLTAPKVNNSAYLMAEIANWNQYKLLSGNSKIYFEETYVGEAFIDVHNTDDTLSLSLGQDKNIIVQREMLKDKSGTKVLGSRKEQKQAFEIKIRNNKTTAVKIKVLEQYPLSQNEEIKVKLGETSGAKVNDKTGELEWNLELTPNSQQQLNFDFDISYPKNMRINL